MRMLSIAFILLALVSCSSTTDITMNPTKMTDFVVGEVYVLKKPCWMRGKALLTLLGREPADSEGLLEKGTMLVVRKVVVERSLELGAYTDVIAEILTGEHRGQDVNVGVISQILKSGYTKRDLEMLEVVEKHHTTR